MARFPGKVPSFIGRTPSSPQATAAARGSSCKRDTRCEILLRCALWNAGCRYHKDVATLPGRPDIVFPAARVAIFCDGDFWHGKDWHERRGKLARGANAPYWLAKIERNMERDRHYTAVLEAAGWTVLRFWESQIHTHREQIVGVILRELDAREHRKSRLDRQRRKAEQACELTATVR